MPVFTFVRQGRFRTKNFRRAEPLPSKQALGQQLRRERITPGAIREKGKEFSMPTFGSGKVKGQGHRNFLPPVLGHDRRWLAAGAVSGKFWLPTRKIRPSRRR